MHSTPLGNDSIASTSAPSINNDRMIVYERELATLLERSIGLAKREELNLLKSEVLLEVSRRLDQNDQKTSSVTRWAIGTVCVAALTLTVAIIGATISVYSTVSGRSAQQVPVAASAPVVLPPTASNYVQHHRIDVVVSVDGANKQ